MVNPNGHDWLVVRKLNIYDHVIRTLISINATYLSLFMYDYNYELFKKNYNLVVCSMVALCRGHMIRKIGKKSRSTQPFTSETYFKKYLCH